MRTVRICNPVEQEPFPQFQHNTTTYVSIEHGHPSQIYVHSDGPSIVSIQVGEQEIFAKRLASPDIIIPLSELTMPEQPASSLMGLLQAAIAKHKNKAQAQPVQRLYMFSVVIYHDRPDKPVACTSDFHLLCPCDFSLASTYHLKLQNDPSAIAPDTIFDRAEGTCPDCRQARERDARCR